MEASKLQKFEDRVFGAASGAVPNDLKLNFRKYFSEASLAPAEAVLFLATAAKSLDFAAGTDLAASLASDAGVRPEELKEAEEIAALMGMLNTYYRFRHALKQGNSEVLLDYERAGLRMTIFSRPIVGKEKIELLAFGASVINGCYDCVVSHEGVLRTLNVPVEKIHDTARLASILKGIANL